VFFPHPEHPLRTTTLIRPDAADRFHCIASACEDTCCRGWAVGVDRAAFNKYRQLPDSPLRTLLDAKVVLNESPADKSLPPHYAAVKLDPGLACPMLNEQSLCRIQAELGAEFLCTTCSTFPRRIQKIDGLEEQPLTLSCPEAARLILLDRNPPGHRRKVLHHLTWDDTTTAPQPLRTWFWPIRAFTLATIHNRDYPLWQRMFLLSAFSRRLDAIACGELNCGFPTFLREFESAVLSGSLRAAIENVPADLHLQLDILLRLVHLRLDPANPSPRFRSCLQDFMRGIGHPASTPAQQVSSYRENYSRFYAPFFASHPNILENYLSNLVFYERFPFGNSLFLPDAAPQPAKAFSHLAIQFALIKGLLIGIAGAYKESFSAAHVVRLVQTVSKRFEHSPSFLSEACALLAERGIDNPTGLTMLLRN
jgi:lysine-N-methylase